MIFNEIVTACRMAETMTQQQRHALAQSLKGFLTPTEIKALMDVLVRTGANCG